MKRILSEKNVVIVLFVMVLITFSLAQEDSKKMERSTTGTATLTASELLVQQLDFKSIIRIPSTPAE